MGCQVLKDKRRQPCRNPHPATHTEGRQVQRLWGRNEHGMFEKQQDFSVAGRGELPNWGSAPLLSSITFLTSLCKEVTPPQPQPQASSITLPFVLVHSGCCNRYWRWGGFGVNDRLLPLTALEAEFEMNSVVSLKGLRVPSQHCQPLQVLWLNALTCLSSSRHFELGFCPCLRTQVPLRRAVVWRRMWQWLVLRASLPGGRVCLDS